MREEEAEANDITVDTFVPHIKYSENSKDIINKLANLTINDIGNDSNGATAGGVQVQFAGDPAGFSPKLIERPCYQDETRGRPCVVSS